MSPSLTFLIQFLSLLATTHGLPTSELVYDYVIVGAGTSGLVVANRLSEIPNVTVAVIEAGQSAFNNENVTDINGYGRAFGTDIDYAYQTVNQTYANGARQIMRAGKAIGGTSTINGMAYTRAEDVQVDAWEELGNSGWKWESLLPYVRVQIQTTFLFLGFLKMQPFSQDFFPSEIKTSGAAALRTSGIHWPKRLARNNSNEVVPNYIKSEQFQIPSDWQVATGITYEAEVHGSAGPLKVGYANDIDHGTFAGTALNQTYANLGQPWNHDVNTGKMRGLTRQPRTLNQAENVREDAARAYYWPFANRTNLVVHSNTVANRIVWKGAGDLNRAVASGVEITSADGTITTISARKEVILSAGALRSSGILELSGVGNPDILEALGIDVVVDLPAVGENLQDQVNSGFSFTSSPVSSGSANFISYPNAEDIYGAHLSSLAEAISTKIPSYAAAVANASNHVIPEADLLKFFKIQYNLLFQSSVPILEIFQTVAPSSVDIQFWSLLPFSRGNIHITSADPHEALTINPNFFMLDVDVDVHVACAKFIRNVLAQAEPLASLVTGESSPGFEVLAADADDAAFAVWLKDTYRTNYHPVGTTAMMSQDLGGVVSDRLVVYGTANVRVVDAGVLPFQVCGHLTSTLYAVAEKAADMIKEDA
ncbi:glucose oxidase [Diplocarpon rosae]|nr:glucose oxidase [Diplocarpon rosae]